MLRTVRRVSEAYHPVLAACCALLATREALAGWLDKPVPLPRRRTGIFGLGPGRCLSPSMLLVPPAKHGDGEINGFAWRTVSISRISRPVTFLDGGPERLGTTREAKRCRDNYGEKHGSCRPQKACHWPLPNVCSDLHDAATNPNASWFPVLSADSVIPWMMQLPFDKQWPRLHQRRLESKLQPVRPSVGFGISWPFAIIEIRLLTTSGKDGLSSGLSDATASESNALPHTLLTRPRSHTSALPRLELQSCFRAKG